MLNPELAKQQLEGLRNQAAWRSSRIKALKALPMTVRETGLAWLGYTAKGSESAHPLDYDQIEKAKGKLQELEDGDRLSFFAALFPQFPEMMEQAWQLLARLPYQVSYNRRPFHAPDRPKLSWNLRYQWLYQLVAALDGYDQDLPWLAAWTPYLGYYSNPFGILFAAAIDSQTAVGNEVYDIILASAKGEHEIGTMGRHVTKALLTASRPEGWELVEKLLVAAQRQEGLRQTILETVDESHPEAFRRILKVVLDEKLTRFSAVTRAVGVWIGYPFEEPNEKLLGRILQQIL